MGGPSKVAELGRCPRARERAPGGICRGVYGVCLVLQAPLRRRSFHPQARAMFSPRELLLLWFLVLVVGGTEHVFGPG